MQERRITRTSGADASNQRGEPCWAGVCMTHGDRPVELRTPTDSALIAGLLLRDENALKALIDSCGKHVYGRALRILVEPGLAEEVAQDTLLALWWRPERFDPSKGSIRSFLTAIARFKAIDLVRREELMREKAVLLADTNAIIGPVGVDDNLDDGLMLRAAISHLPLRKREVIFLAFYRGLTYREVAEVLGLPEGTVKTRIRDSLLRLKMDIATPETA